MINDDGMFDSKDLVQVLQAGAYETAATPPCSDVTIAVDAILAELILFDVFQERKASHAVNASSDSTTIEVSSVTIW